MTLPQYVLSQGTTSRDHVGIERTYPNLRFERPVFLCGAGDDSGRIFVVEQDGVIRVFDRVSNEKTDQVKSTDVFLDIRDRISRVGNEEGLLGLAFHPDFKNNGQFFVHYSSTRIPGEGKISSNVLSRFTISKANPNQADPDSEEIILTQRQPFRNHNGGMIAFGHDGFLYLSFGDGGKANDPEGNGQKLNSMLGSIIRINVDQTVGDQNYAIPSDNPFVDNLDARPEIWAIGLRNVWRFSFDRNTGELYAAEVGQNKLEEVNIIKKGGNYGWNRFEANELFDESTELIAGEHDAPIAIYDHSWGLSITGGYVYRGTDYPELQGQYFYGDYITGNLWSLSKNKEGKFQDRLVRRTGRSIASFGEDDQGELYLLSFDGGLYRIVSTEEPENQLADWPAKLSETGLYASTEERTVSPKLIPYSVNAPFWSDGADKDRYFLLPDGEKLTFHESESWRVPAGSTIVKNFWGRHGNRRIPLETRLIKRTDTGWESATYVWSAPFKDAELLVDGKQFELWNWKNRRTTVDVWHAPSSSECASCHVDAAGYVLGLNTAQLNRDVEGVNQILKWAEAGLLDLPSDFNLDQAKRFCSPLDEEATLDQRARVYLDVNCAMCHRPNGPGNANIDLRFATRLSDTKMIDQPPAQGDMGIADARLVAPGAPERSLLLHRIKTLGAGRMPNIGSNLADPKAVELLQNWIESLKPQ